MRTYLPSEVYVIGDNVEAMKIAADCHCSDKLTPSPDSNACHIATQMDHHWVLLSYFNKQATDRDNGFMALLIPKSTMDKERVAHFFADLISEGGMQVKATGILDVSPGRQ